MEPIDVQLPALAVAFIAGMVTGMLFLGVVLGRIVAMILDRDRDNRYWPR